MRTTTVTAVLFFAATTLFAEVVAPNGSKQLPGYRTSWIGNTYGGLDADGKGQWVQQDIAAMHVTPDGTVYTNVPWEEAGGNCMMYKDGKMLGAAMHTHGWGFNGGKAVAVNDKYVFIALMGNNEGGGLVDPDTWPPKGYDWYGVSRRLRSDFTKGAPFEHGKGGKGDTLPKSFLVVNEVPSGGGIDGPGAITGLWATNERLYVTNPIENRIEIYDAETMLKIDEWDLTQYEFTEPGQIAADNNGNIWVQHIETRNFREDYAVTQFDRDGQKMRGRIQLSGPFCFGPNNEVYAFPYYGVFGIVTATLNEEGYNNEEEGDFEKTDRLFNFADAKSTGGIGLTIGGFTGSGFGKFRDLWFGMSSIKALGCDMEGNLYIAQDLSTNGGGTVLESYKLTGKEKEPPFPEWSEGMGPFLDAELRWRLFGFCFIDCATLDPDDETIVYTKEEKYKLNWSQTQPGMEWSFIGTTTAIPESDPRFQIKDSAGVWVRNFDDTKLLFVNDMNAQWMQVYCLWPDEQESDEKEAEIGVLGTFLAFFAGKKPIFPTNAINRIGSDGALRDIPNENGEWILMGNSDYDFQPGKSEPTAQGWWVDSECNVWRASETEGIRRFRCVKEDRENPIWNFENLDTFPHPAEFSQVKRIRYDPETDTLYLGGCAAVDGVEHKNQHWKPMGPVICRYDNFLQGEKPGSTEGKLRWRTVMPYVVGSSGHESCEPMGFDVAGDYVFVPYTGASRESGFKTGHVEVIRADDAVPVGWMEPDPKTVGEIGLQDIRECLSAHKLQSGEYVIFLEDDYKAKVVMYRWTP